MNKYNRVIIGSDEDGNTTPVFVDFYDVIDAFDVTCPALQHLIKKALVAGKRGYKDIDQDLVDIRDSSQKAIILQEKRGLK